MVMGSGQKGWRWLGREEMSIDAPPVPGVGGNFAISSLQHNVFSDSVGQVLRLHNLGYIYMYFR